jgi:hypothetical protein
MELAIKERTHDTPIAEHVNIEYDDNITTEKFPDHPEDTQTRDNETPHQAAHNTNIQNIRNPYTKQNLNNAAQNNIIHGLSTSISKTLVTPSISLHINSHPTQYNWYSQKTMKTIPEGLYRTLILIILENVSYL